MMSSPLLCSRLLAMGTRNVHNIPYHSKFNLVPAGSAASHELQPAPRWLHLHRVRLPLIPATSRHRFHTTPSRRAACFPLLSFLKMSSAIPFVGTISRVTLTFVPFLFLERFRQRHLRPATPEERQELWPPPKTRREHIAHMLRARALLFHLLFLIPLTLVGLTLLASLERAPLTGRWRLMLLSPEEEREIAAHLAGPGWRQAVLSILTQDQDRDRDRDRAGPPPLLAPADWRHAWVHTTLRRLEAAIPVLQRERELLPDWMDGPDDVPRPPPAVIPLYHRPRAAPRGMRFAAAMRATGSLDGAQPIEGPPYSLLVVDEPAAANAFSYGFGPDGAGGIVVFSGFLDDVLAKHPCAEPVARTEEPENTAWWARVFGGLFSLEKPPVAAPPVPTEEQTSELAILLAHELAHLILSHHIETLSTGSILAPGVTSIVTDVVRTILFPVTMMLGPFINDALAGVGKAGSGEVVKMTEYCTSQEQEIEADIVSARLLSHAGFDPRRAVEFWEGRQDTLQTAECSLARTDALPPHRWTGATHPVNKVRVQKLKQELRRWEVMRRTAREQKRSMKGSSGRV